MIYQGRILGWWLDFLIYNLQRLWRYHQARSIINLAARGNASYFLIKTKRDFKMTLIIVKIPAMINKTNK
ncbi:hypothetical protein, partial [Tolypothrix sp. FACHB-123]|uniref:hypothetical protein n=1 Tax=Tolypothrix sp. FACHB-123 TaxID=2692868 RepID=UPI001F54BEE2